MRDFTLDKEYITEVVIDRELTLGEDLVTDTGEVLYEEGESFVFRDIIDHPRFSNFRHRLERMGYISIGEMDFALKDFRVNRSLFLEGEIFPRAEQLRNRYAF